MKSNLLYVLLLLLMNGLSSLNAQNSSVFNQLQREGTKTSASHSVIHQSATVGSVKATLGTTANVETSKPILVKPNLSNITEEELQAKKAAANAEKMANAQLHSNSTEQVSGLAQVDPSVTLGVKGNSNNGWTPSDNHIAVSNDGYVVSVANSTFVVSDINGNILTSTTFASFMSNANLPDQFFSPKVIFDPIEQRFVMVVANGDSPSNNSMVLGFSTSSDPTESWWLYILSGDPNGENQWTTSPKLGLTSTEVYVSGNQFNANNIFEESVIYQIDKANGFIGGTLSWMIWSDIDDANGDKGFNIVPMSEAMGASIGPGIVFMSANTTGSNDVMLYWTTGTINDNPSLLVNRIEVPTYTLSGDGLQFGSSDLLRTGDCRMLGGFFKNNIVHFVMNVAYSNTTNTGVYYGRLDLGTLTATQRTFGLGQYEYAYPNLVPFSTKENDQSVAISFLRTGASIYPEVRVVTCDNDYNFSASVQLRGGDSYINATTSTLERWGHYTGIARRYSANDNEVWISGGYGTASDGGYTNTLTSWISRVNGADAQIQAPNANFTANRTTITAGESIQFTDLSTNNPTSWYWGFPNNTPTYYSTQQNPVVTFSEPGVYSVNMTATNSAGNDSEFRTNYIIVTDGVQVPVANFTSNTQQVDEGGLVSFTDLSANNPTAWVWSFPGGTPSTTDEQSPTIRYNNAGVYNVSLTSFNSAGNNVIVKTGYITVFGNEQRPVTNFTADTREIDEGGLVTFTDLSTNNPSQWSWSFPGGTPSFSSERSPVVRYNEAGAYNVILVTSNGAGSDEEFKSEYITVLENVQTPVANFTANTREIDAGGVVAFTDLSANNPTSWVWSFPGGSPSTSDEKSPVVTYSEPGIYDVSLISANSAGNDAVVKTDYILVLETVQAPVADFKADRREIEEGESVTFTDLSTNNPTSRVWSFPGGSPSTSDELSPTVTYDEPGTYNVSLVSYNSAGNDAEVKTAYITVVKGAEAPVANFKADQTLINAGGLIQFTDLSTNEPTSWVWSFPGGTPNTSTLQNPIITYDSPGIFDVTLIVSNSEGSTSITEEAYISVDGTSSTNDLNSPVSEFVLFPNPSNGVDDISVKFTVTESVKLDFYLTDNTGRTIKHLLREQSRLGENQFSFNAGLLSSGLYFLNLKNEQGQVLKQAKVIIH